MNAAPIYLGEPGIVCSLGSGAAQVRRAMLHSGEPLGLTTTESFTRGRPLALGCVHAPLPSLDDYAIPLRGRNNQLLLAAYGQIRQQCQAAIERWGACRVGVAVGTSTSGIGEAERAFYYRREHGALPSFFDYAQQEIGMPSRFLALACGALGPAITISTACTSGVKALASAARWLRAGICDAVIAGGSDSLCSFTINGFSALESVSAERCNPFSVNRCGINIGEGAALFLLTREENTVRLSGWGETADAYHMSAPDPSGEGAIAAIEQALQSAQLKAAQIDYLNLHGTATPHNDAMESIAVDKALGRGVAASSTKPLTGHTLGAAGAIEMALCYLTLIDNPARSLPPHWWDAQPDAQLPPIHLAAPGERAPRLRHALSQSFAFGGSNAAAIFSSE